MTPSLHQTVRVLRAHVQRIVCFERLLMFESHHFRQRNSNRSDIHVSVPDSLLKFHVWWIAVLEIRGFPW